MGNFKEVLEVKAGDNMSTAIGKTLIDEGIKYATAFGIIGGIFILAGKIEDKVEEMRVQKEEEQGE